MEDEHFAAVVQTFGIKITRRCRKTADDRATRAKQQLLAVLQHPENRKKSVTEICHLAGFASKTPWVNAIKDELFVATIVALGVPIKRHHCVSHLEVELAPNIEEELAKDVWDMRRFKHEYPKHRVPSQLDFVHFQLDAGSVKQALQLGGGKQTDIGISRGCLIACRLPDLAAQARQHIMKRGMRLAIPGRLLDLQGACLGHLSEGLGH